ncbi:glycosyl hydrolase family 95 catalytic domain-containing protein [Paenibacillus segetis]|uniref:Uncharacterized protein n=1 Tax=Paenibacillus segetis TaxID=1325360 RepID=A0ABQ1Y441_9BACL|nr:hypothetical protein [Paenibacillus segetis]GGH10870.1 hypothetical protein GCM10008013_02480 [Paenibacillus segetis]
MYNSIYFDGTALQVDRERYLRKHDVIYQSPTYKGYEGLPIGNGDMGGMLFHTPSSIEFVLNKTDVIDFGENGNFKAWAWESEEKNTAPVSCGKISITDGLPSFDWVYLKDYEARLNISEGVATIASQTPFSSYSYKTYAAEEPSVLVMEVEATSLEAVERKITLEKWGSPNFFHYYEQISTTYDKNLFNTHTGKKDNCVYIEQQLEGTHYIMAAKVIGEEVEIKLPNSHGCEIILPKSKSHKFTLLTTVIVSQEGKVDLQEATQRLEQIEQGYNQLFLDHKQRWNEFWSKSFVHLSEDDYLENLYYLNLYQLNSCSRGKYPITFAGLWGWFKDTRNWGHFYHWNHQQTYWGVHAANHSELADNYYRYRMNMLENAKADATNLYQSNGAYFSDISNLNGYNAIEPDTIRNFTVGPQIALDLYKHYLYTGDLVFLEEQAYPFMRSCADLYCDMLVKEEGVYRIKGGSTSYESYWNLKDTTTDHALITALLNALLATKELVDLEDEQAELYKDILRCLYPLNTVSVEHDAQTIEIWSDGTQWNDQKVGYCEGEYPMSPFPGSQLAMVYPASVIGLHNQDKAEFGLARNTARVIFDREVYQLGKMGCSGHTPAPEIAARLGMSEDMFPILHKFITTYQMFPNGFMHFADISQDQQWAKIFNPRILPQEGQTQWEEVHDKSKGERTLIPSETFLHCYFESAANVMAGIHEMLLQSYHGFIHVFPAVPEHYSAVFTLQAVGNFEVTSEKKGQDVRYIHIVSHNGGKCRVKNPWNTSQIRVISGHKQVEFCFVGDLIEFDTCEQQGYSIVRREYPLENYYQDKLTAKPNQNVKTFQTSRLGKSKVY